MKISLSAIALHRVGVVPSCCGPVYMYPRDLRNDDDPHFVGDPCAGKSFCGQQAE